MLEGLMPGGMLVPEMVPLPELLASRMLVLSVLVLGVLLLEMLESEMLKSEMLESEILKSEMLDSKMLLLLVPGVLVTLVHSKTWEYTRNDLESWK